MLPPQARRGHYTSTCRPSVDQHAATLLRGGAHTARETTLRVIHFQVDRRTKGLETPRPDLSIRWPRGDLGIPPLDGRLMASIENEACPSIYLGVMKDVMGFEPMVGCLALPRGTTQRPLVSVAPNLASVTLKPLGHTSINTLVGLAVSEPASTRFLLRADLPHSRLAHILTKGGLRLHHLRSVVRFALRRLGLQHPCEVPCLLIHHRSRRFRWSQINAANFSRFSRGRWLLRRHCMIFGVFDSADCLQPLRDCGPNETSSTNHPSPCELGVNLIERTLRY